jgi:hypothetical protein
MSVDTHVQALPDPIRADHGERMAEIRASAEDAAARGDLNAQRRHLADIDRLEALPKPWQSESAEL